MAKINTVADIIDAIQKDGVARVTGLGTFKVVDKAARQGRNPATGAVIDIPAKKKLQFSAAGTFADKLNEVA